MSVSSGRFEKRNIPWNKNLKGIHLSPNSEFKKGQKPWNIGKVGSEWAKKHGIGKWMKGRKLSQETRKKMSLNNSRYWKGKKRSPDTRMKISQGHLGKKVSEKTRQLLREKNSKEKHPQWKGGITPINKSIRNSLEYKLWRESVLKRDNWTCVWCGARSGRGKRIILNADHIKPFCLFPVLRFALDNGRTLCEDCHRKTETYAYGAKYYKIKHE